MPSSRSEVVVVDVQMPFFTMVLFILKWTLASIPAFIILAILGGIVAAVLGGLFAGLMM